MPSKSLSRKGGFGWSTLTSLTKTCGEIYQKYEATITQKLGECGENDSKYIMIPDQKPSSIVEGNTTLKTMLDDLHLDFVKITQTISTQDRFISKKCDDYTPNFTSYDTFINTFLVKLDKFVRTKEAIKQSTNAYTQYSPPTSPPTMGGGKKTQPLSKTAKTVKVGNATRCVYKGPRGGEYVKMQGKLVSVTAATRTKKK